MSRLTGEGDHVVLANRNHLDGECVFVVVGVGVDVVTDELLAVLILDRDHGLEKLHQRLPLALRGWRLAHFMLCSGPRKSASRFVTQVY